MIKEEKVGLYEKIEILALILKVRFCRNQIKINKFYSKMKESSEPNNDEIPSNSGENFPLHWRSAHNRLFQKFQLNDMIVSIIACIVEIILVRNSYLDMIPKMNPTSEFDKLFSLVTELFSNRGFTTFFLNLFEKAVFLRLAISLIVLMKGLFF